MQEHPNTTPFKRLVIVKFEHHNFSCFTLFDVFQGTRVVIFSNPIIYKSKLKLTYKVGNIILEPNHQHFRDQLEQSVFQGNWLIVIWLWSSLHIWYQGDIEIVDAPKQRISSIEFLKEIYKAYLDEIPQANRNSVLKLSGHGLFSFQRPRRASWIFISVKGGNKNSKVLWWKDQIAWVN